MKKQNIERKILGKIKSGEIKMKPKWKFVMAMWEQRIIWLMFILGAGLSILGINYFARKYNPKELVEFGSVGWSVFYEDFPYYWLAGAVIFWILAIKIWLNLGNNYRVALKKVIIVGALTLITIIALVLFLG